MKVQQVAIRGTPDFLLCVNGYFVALELKKEARDKPSELQRLNLKKISHAGGIGLVTHPGNWDSVLEFLQVLATKGYDEAKEILH